MNKLSLRVRFKKLCEDITKLQSHREFLAKQHQEAEDFISKAKYSAELQQKSSEVIKSWLDDMLKSNVDSMAELATSGLRNIINDQDLTFRIIRESKYNRVSMRFAIEHDGVEGHPMSSFGGGALLIASLILRLSVMSQLKMGNLLLLDETMFALANQYVPAAAAFMRQLSEDTGINILMVTHNNEFMSNAHVAYEGNLARLPSGKKALRLRRRNV